MTDRETAKPKMKVLRPGQSSCLELPMQGLSEELSDEDRERFEAIVSENLADWQVRQIVEPGQVFPRQDTLLAVHWHPEFVPLPYVRQRLDAMFPHKTSELVIPTDHNELRAFGGYSGVEVDCYSRGFNRKVQLLLHFAEAKVERADTLKSILEHTFKYRSSQLFEYLRALAKPQEDPARKAARETGSDAEIVEFTRINAVKIEKLLNSNWSSVPTKSLKNKLLLNWFDALSPQIGELATGRVKVYLRAVKEQVKARFSLKYFYRASEVIEEVRALGGGVVIPHPEQFWPILLADYDVDGIEVWNPQSREYTDFLISVVGKQNQQRAAGKREILIFMGDDCHLGEKTKPLNQQDPEKSSREVGVQTAWDDLELQKKLILLGVSRRSVIEEYKNRLAG